MYQHRKKMYEYGVTSPSPEIKKFINDFVSKLMEMPLEEEIYIRESEFYDSSGKMIAKIPE